MEQQERIDKYLHQQMEAAEQAKFEAELATNPDLSESVDLQRDIASFFKEKTPALEAILAEEGNRHFQEETGKNGFKYWKWLLPLLVLPIGVILWWSQQSNSTTTTVTNESPLTKEVESPFFADTISDMPPPVLEETPSENLPEETQGDQQKKTTKPAKQKELIASANPVDFRPNPVIESIMAEQVRATENITKIAIPVKDAIFPFAPNIPFQVSGTTNNAPPYTLSVYSNSVFDFENDYKVLSTSLSGTPKEENYSFSFNATIPFPKGLYYLFLQSEDEDILAIARFKIE